MLVAEYGTAGGGVVRGGGGGLGGGACALARLAQRRRGVVWVGGGVAESTCWLWELGGVCWSGWRGIGPTLDVVTPAGRARLPQVAANFEAVRAALVGGLKPGAALPWYEYPAAQALLLLLV